MRHLETSHAAQAPLVVGREGSAVFDKCMNGLRSILNPKVTDERSVFAKLRAAARPKKPGA